VTAPTVTLDERGRRIGEVADELGITARTIRYYEELGLLGEAELRQKGTHRLYTEADVTRLRELLRLRDLLGLSLDELTELADTAQVQLWLKGQWENSTGDDERAVIMRSSIANAQRQLDLVHARLASLADFETQLTDKIARINTALSELGR
jgi:DNA-binding transcriptional MerR regulator